MNISFVCYQLRVAYSLHYSFSIQILSEQKELVDTETEFFIRDRENLDDFLYEIESSNLKREAGNNFD